MDQYP